MKQIIAPLLAFYTLQAYRVTVSAFTATNSKLPVINPTSAFPIFATESSSAATASSSSSSSDANEHTKEEKAKLIFRGSVELTTDNLPPETQKEDVYEFLSAKEHRDILLSSGGERAVEQVTQDHPKYNELITIWKNLCESDYGVEYLPADNDAILQCDTKIAFPGLTVINTIYNGVKETPVEEDDNTGTSTSSGVSKYDLVMIGENLDCQGSPPIRWIFEKLTGASQKETLDPSGRAKSRLRIVENETDGSLAFGFDANVEIRIKFPATLLKILPTNREKAEASGSKSIQKQIDKDAGSSTEAMYKAFLEWNEKGSVST